MGVIVICVFRPKRGQASRLLEIVRGHVPLLRQLGLATSRIPIVGRAKDGSIVEIFEWVSEEAIDAAHAHPTVLALWKRFERACTHCSLRDLAESASPFPGFEPVDLGPAVEASEWMDLTVAAAEKTRDFYRRVVGFAVTDVPMGDYDDYCMVAGDGRTVAGVCHAAGPNRDVPSGWLPYFNVASLSKSLAAAKRSGGRAVGKVRDLGSGRMCIVRDPSGSYAALFEHKAAKSTSRRRRV